MSKHVVNVCVCVCVGVCDTVFVLEFVFVHVSVDSSFLMYIAQGENNKDKPP